MREVAENLQICAPEESAHSREQSYVYGLMIIGKQTCFRSVSFVICSQGKSSSVDALLLIYLCQIFSIPPPKKKKKKKAHNQYVFFTMQQVRMQLVLNYYLLIRYISVQYSGVGTAHLRICEHTHTIFSLPQLHIRNLGHVCTT